MKVFVYYNLHKKLYSIKSLETGRVIGHAPTVVLEDATFKVSAAGRARVLKEQRKNVHAGVVGELAATRNVDVYSLRTQLHHSDHQIAMLRDTLPIDKAAASQAITYNPYKFSSFVTVGDEKAVEGAEIVVLSKQGVKAGGVTFAAPGAPETPPAAPTRRKAAIKSSIIYQGASLIDGQPIMVVAITKSANVKTGGMVQTYIMRSDLSPLDASKGGQDLSICGKCPHRGQANNDPALKQAKHRSCYVTLGQAPTGIYKSFLKGNYPVTLEPGNIAALAAGRMVRLGTYGDPAAVPSHVWDALLSKAKGHTAYTHQAEQPGADVRNDLFMQSADTLSAARSYWLQQLRTFRVISDVAEVEPGREILCPASAEAGRVTTCDRCKLCSGSESNGKSIAIVGHGAGSTHIAINLQ